MVLVQWCRGFLFSEFTDIQPVADNLSSELDPTSETMEVHTSPFIN